MSNNSQKIVLLLVGLIGSGKSTFAEALEQHLPSFKRCNQDDLGNRQRVEALARESLNAGMSVCIDRTNFDARQRATWINIAREFPGTEAWVLVFDTPSEVCAQRLRERTNHPTIKTPEDALSILARFLSQYQGPSPHEGYTRFLSLPPSEQLPKYTRQDVLGVLDRLRDAPPPPPQPQTRVDAFFPPSYSDRGWRGRGQHHGHGGGVGYRGFRGSSGPTRRGAYVAYMSRGCTMTAGAVPEQTRLPDYGANHSYSRGRGRGGMDSDSWRRDEKKP